MEQLANALRVLSLDAVEKAKSGHVGLPLGMADAASVLWTKHLVHNPADPDWPNRDRFILSAGHGSMLLYALLYLTGYLSVGLDDIKAFRQHGSNTPGHPENFVTKGVETTTGPLGQGLAAAVGMAIAERHMNAKHGDDAIRHKTYVIAGDGCLMEGVSQEAISLAGHMKLSNLIVLFDDNGITIDGGTDLADSTDQCLRFEASGWVSRRVDGHDFEDVDQALSWAKEQDRPVLLAVKTIIGFGAERAATNKAHGGPYGSDEASYVRRSLNWDHEPFVIPEPILSAWRDHGSRCLNAYEKWQTINAESLDPIKRELACELPNTLGEVIAEIKEKAAAKNAAAATRQSSGDVLDKIVDVVPQLLGGSADLTGSNNSRGAGIAGLTSENRGGRYIHYGVREHGMAAAMNGMAQYGGIIPYAGTFLCFSDYSRPAIRLGALMGAQVIHVMTHDSIGLGEDGPTHQPVEHLSSLRAIPNLHVFRPCDAVEVAECWELALERSQGPSLLALSRQKVPLVRTKHSPANMSAKGAYVLSEAEEPCAVIVATGSEVQIALLAQERLRQNGVAVRVVSAPCLELFWSQPDDYQQQVLPQSVPRVVVEAGVIHGWQGILGPSGAFVGMSGFGASAPADRLYESFQITAEAVALRVIELISGQSAQPNEIVNAMHS